MAYMSAGIYERSDAKVREKEGMERKKGFLSAPFDTQVPITENGIHYLVDVENGQKTGFFLDQKLNRLAIRPMCRNADVLDCFTHTGSFGLNAAAGGARHVLSVDASDTAIRQAEENAQLNGCADRIDYLTADVFELLPRLESEKKQFDVVILDPPAFTKSRNSIRAATRGYPGNQSPGNEADQKRRLSCHLLLLPFYGSGSVCPHDCPGRP